MAEHTIKSYEQELERVAAGIARMGGLAESQLADALEALMKRDGVLAEKTIESDGPIDQLLADIEAQVLRILALRQPVAVDLREIISALKIASDLERIGDLAKNVAKRSQILNQSQPIRSLRGLLRMGKLVQGQLKDVLDAYADRDDQRALAVWRRDEEVDDINNSLFREILTYMLEDPRTITPCTHLLFIAKNLERVGDHATNIAETVHYLRTGQPITQIRPKGDLTSSADLMSLPPGSTGK